MQIGWKIRKLRQENNITLRDLAAKAGLSAGLISQIERDIICPTIDTLWKISEALNIHIGYFFNTETIESNPVVKKTDRKKIILSDSNAIYELLCPNLQGKIEFLQLTLAPGGNANRNQIHHEGDECGIVVQGRLMIHLGYKEYILEEGDSIYFDSTIPHRFINIGNVTSISYWAMTPPSF